MDLAHEKKSFLNKFKEADSQDSINSLKIEYLGKKGVLSSLMSQLSNAPAEKKPKLGKSINKFKSLVEFLENGFQKFPDKVAYENMGKQITFKELDELTKVFSNYLIHELKLEKGDRLAIQSPNLLQYPVVLFGALRSGLVVVNTNPLYTPDEMLHQFKDSGCKAIFILRCL